MLVDVECILMYMRMRNGVMLYSDKSQFDDIRECFNMSKVVFKCVLGYLMKNGKVYQENGWIYEKKQYENGLFVVDCGVSCFFMFSLIY